jgi:rhodanese-related sulfurtransferase
MKRLYLGGICSVVLTLMLGLNTVSGQGIQLPRISIDELKVLLDEKADILILDTQPEKLYKLQHIKGARSFPFKIQPQWSDLEPFPDDKLIVLYCDCGPGEADSNHMGLKLKEMGFLEIKVLAHPSIRGWIERGYPIE